MQCIVDAAPPVSTVPDEPELGAALASELGSEFELGDVVGSGGFAVVFRARDHTLHRDVAVKVLRPTVTLDEKAENRFRHEARLIAGLEHPNIVPVFRAGIAGRVPYIVMRFVVGRSLEQVLEERGSRPLEWAEATRIALQAADALAYAHARGVIHLDIKPGNLLLDQLQNVLVADFGIARATATQAAPATAGGDAGRTGGAAYSTISGTPRYMSPEQALGETVDARADVYALGVVLHQMLTGRVPFDAPSVAATLKQQLDTDFRFLDVPEVLPQLRPILRRALAPSSGDRFADAGELRDALAGYRAAMASRSARRRIAALGVLATVATAIGLLWMAVSKDALARRSPALDAIGNIPAPLLQQLRDLGALDSGEVVRFVFAPAGATVRDAFVLTDRRAMRLTAGVPRAYPAADMRGVSVVGMGGGRKATVLFVGRPGGAIRSDTLFTALGDRESADLNEKLVVFLSAR